ncbi:Protein of unknown function [Solimonas aquatica]|uniref:DUF3187 family protein n=1 Tax=Solimonas aquatica TaxID=489703 RepID=A0A1H9J7F5_9GAMM|nr:DUF3187 family protein [Solimonas aquatica]SEQ82716.1 Protein of unknown function [Solimonas aquatica]
MLRRSVLLLALLLSGAVQAEPFVLGTSNQAALARHAPLPTPQADATGSGLRLSLDWTNEFVLDQRGTEALLLDGETLRLNLAARWNWRGWLLGAELPVLNTSGGVLDSPIESWHQFFGLPNGNREDEPRKQYRDVYQRNGQTLLDLDSGKTGIGDARLSLARCGAAGCWRGLLQLPTGDAERLMGGGLGGALWYERPYAFAAGGAWSGALAAGVAAVRADGPLQDQQRQFIPFGWASLGYQLLARLELGAQFYLHGPLYSDSELAALRRPGGQLAFGLRYRPTPQTSLWLGAQEDPIIESSPDFSIHLAVDWH